MHKIRHDKISLKEYSGKLSRKQMDEYIFELEKQSSGVLKWLANLYNKEQKGFHAAVSALDDPKKYYCSLSATAQALNILKYLDLIRGMPGEFRNNLIEFFQSRQDPGDGYFKDDDPNMYNNPNNLGRAVSYSVNALNLLGAAPLYPLPGEEGGNDRYPEFESGKKFKSWLESLDMDNPYQIGNELQQARLPVFKTLKKEKQNELADVLKQFLARYQSGITGYWGKDPAKNNHIYASGAYKIAWFYTEFIPVVPEADKILGSVAALLKDSREEVRSSYCFVRNPLSLLEMIDSSLENNISEQDALDIIHYTVVHSSMFVQADGGFSRRHDSSLAFDNHQELCKGLKEGDMNATTQAVHTVRRVSYSIAGFVQPRIAGYDSFYKMLVRLL